MAALRPAVTGATAAAVAVATPSGSAADRGRASARSLSAALAGPPQPPEREQQLPGWRSHCPTRPRPARRGKLRTPQPSPVPWEPAPPSCTSPARLRLESGHLGAPPREWLQAHLPIEFALCLAVPLVEEGAQGAAPRAAEASLVGVPVIKQKVGKPEEQKSPQDRLRFSRTEREDGDGERTSRVPRCG